MAKIQTIKNKDNTIIYPQTHSTAVFTSDGVQLQNKLNQYLTTEDIGQMDEINTDIEFQTNKVLEVNKNSTNATYPSSKAVYDAIVANKEVGIKIEIFATRDEITNPNEKTIYLIGNESPYEEYLYLGSDNWELIGTTQIDLSNYLTTTIADEKYAKLSLYGDTTINIGRKANTTVGSNSVAEGYYTTASGSQSHAEGYYTKASGNESHAEGNGTKASGNESHAEGIGTKASGTCSHAEGYFTQADSSYQHTQGKYNIVDSNKTYAHIVGNGEGESERSNAHTLDWLGNAWFEGDVYIGSTSGINKDDGSKKLATEEYVNNKTNGLASQTYVDNKIIYGTTSLEDGVSELATGTLYVVYE